MAVPPHPLIEGAAERKTLALRHPSEPFVFEKRGYGLPPIRLDKQDCFGGRQFEFVTFTREFSFDPLGKNPPKDVEWESTIAIAPR